MADKIKLKSISERSFFASGGRIVNKNDVFDETPQDAKYLVGRGLAVIYKEETEQEKSLTTESETVLVPKKKSKKLTAKN